jgi:hypothetical protein
MKELSEKLEKETKRFQERMDAALKLVKVLDPRGNDLVQMAKAYYKDSLHFGKKGDVISAFEAVNISWGYLDSGLRLGLLEVPLELKRWFTVD